MSDDQSETLHEQVADVLCSWPIGFGFYRLTVGHDEADQMAAAILATPEMQAIRSTLLWVIECFGSGNDELPDSVYQWACGAE